MKETSNGLRHPRDSATENPQSLKVNSNIRLIEFNIKSNPIRSIHENEFFALAKIIKGDIDGGRSGPVQPSHIGRGIAPAIHRKDRYTANISSAFYGILTILAILKYYNYHNFLLSKNYDRHVAGTFSALTRHINENPKKLFRSVFRKSHTYNFDRLVFSDCHSNL
jgi:hypothetical protein